ncbi:Hypothetical protein POVR1_LOCUS573 [uncultured virus]|nr:Hypothetical protein POVR1_LOCUS573 [uncultured virus]
MSDTISVRVSTGEIILVEIDHLKKYSTSPLSTHALEFQQDVYVLEDVDYPAFQQIHDVMKGQKKETELPEDIWKLAEKYGLTCDCLHYYRMEQDKQTKLEMANLESFLRGDVKFFSHPNIALYDSVFQSHPTIQKVQVLFARQKILGIFFRGIPLYFSRIGFVVEPKSDKYQSRVLSLRSKVHLPDVIHVNEQRQRIIFDDSDLRAYYGDDVANDDLLNLRSLKFDLQAKEESDIKDDTWSERLLDEFGRRSFNEGDLFGSDIERFLDTAMKLSFIYDSNILHCHDRFQLYKDTTVKVTSQEVDKFFKILSDHPEAVTDQKTLHGQFRYHFNVDCESDDLLVNILHQFYVNLI